MPYCQNCGKEIAAESSVCPSCGVPPRKGKSKTVSILLAVFLSFWTWLYTYKRDKSKFWIGLGVSIGISAITAGMIASTIASSIASAGAYAGPEEIAAAIVGSIAGTTLLSLVSTGIWVWTIVDTAIKKQEWYDNYN